MADKVTELRSLLVDILGADNVYLQAPPNTQMNYPCILLQLADIDTKHADDGAFVLTPKYTMTHIFRTDTGVTVNLLQLPRTSFDRRFIADNLYHDVITIYV